MHGFTDAVPYRFDNSLLAFCGGALLSSSGEDFPGRVCGRRTKITDVTIDLEAKEK